MFCEVCGRYCGTLPYVWNDDPWICSEGCAWSYSEHDESER